MSKSSALASLVLLMLLASGGLANEPFYPGMSAVQPVGYYPGYAMGEASNCGPMGCGPMVVPSSCEQPPCGPMASGTPCGTMNYLCDPTDGYPSSEPSWICSYLASAAPIWDGWEISAGAVYMTREAPRNADFLLSSATSATLLDANRVLVDWSYGPWISVDKQLDECGVWKANVVYYGIDGWDYHHQFDETIAYGSGGPRAGTVAPAGGSVDFDYASHLYNVEVNLVRPIGERLELLAGYRWMEIGDKFSLSGASSVNYRALNHLNGFQLGAQVRDLLGPCRRLNFSTMVKAGAYANGGKSSYSSGANQMNFSDKQTSFVGELAVDCTYRVTQHMHLFTGYEALWVDGIALAPNQMTGTVVDFRDTALFHGARFGMQVSW